MEWCNNSLIVDGKALDGGQDDLDVRRSRLTMTSEQRACQQIDLLLQRCGWIFQNRSQTNLAAGPGVPSARPY